jgi:hypothetical protein
LVRWRVEVAGELLFKRTEEEKGFGWPGSCPRQGIQTVPITNCAVTSATFIEDAYRRAVSGALGELAGEGEQEPAQ